MILLHKFIGYLPEEELNQINTQGDVKCDQLMADLDDIFF